MGVKTSGEEEAAEGSVAAVVVARNGEKAAQVKMLMLAIVVCGEEKATGASVEVRRTTAAVLVGEEKATGVSVEVKRTTAAVSVGVGKHRVQVLSEAMIRRGVKQRSNRPMRFAIEFRNLRQIVVNTCCLDLATNPRPAMTMDYALNRNRFTDVRRVRVRVRNLSLRLDLNRYLPHQSLKLKVLPTLFPTRPSEKSR